MVASVRSVLVICAASVTIFASCSNSGSHDAARDHAASITVSAAASLTDAFTEIAELYTEQQSTNVDLNFAGSSTLVEQVIRGAPVEVFASADAEQMSRLADHTSETPSVFAENRLVLVSPENGRALSSLGDLAEAADSGGVVSLCEVSVPCGRLGDEALMAADVVIPETRISRAPNVRAALRSVVSGDSVGGLAYRTDSLAAGDTVHSSELDPELPATTEYLIAPIIQSEPRNNPAAERFVDLVLSEDGREILQRWGFTLD